ncbi:nucleoside transporter [Haemophilus influenzae]|uniref:Nucleoside transporter n=1 Tax=Haemophilus influenzae TaxID=727 RepID=A0A2X1QMQ4_HAEIF|nr:nucleoside transporter [Haemophilus influenzae]
MNLWVYLEFAKYLQPDSAIVLTEKTKAIITFALCGFANFSSIAILIGGLGGMAPSRRSDVARLGIKAVIAGTLANLNECNYCWFIYRLRCCSTLIYLNQLKSAVKNDRTLFILFIIKK